MLAAIRQARVPCGHPTPIQHAPSDGFPGRTTWRSHWLRRALHADGAPPASLSDATSPHAAGRGFLHVKEGM